MCEADYSVKAVAQRFHAAKSRFDKENGALRRELYRAFYRLWDGKAGDRISADVGGRYWVEGRAVILLNGTKMGLCVDTGQERFPVNLPYRECAKVITTKRMRRS